MIVGLFLGIVIGLVVFGIQFLIPEKKTYEKTDPPTEFDKVLECEKHDGTWVSGKCYND